MHTLWQSMRRRQCARMVEPGGGGAWRSSSLEGSGVRDVL